MSTHGERGGNACKRRHQAFHSDLMGQKGVKRPQIHMYCLDLELPSTADHTFRLEGIRPFWYSPANLSLPLFLSRGFPVWLRPDF
jgi:hypothetical protein